jgi:hypothetical protein
LRGSRIKPLRWAITDVVRVACNKFQTRTFGVEELATAA